MNAIKGLSQFAAALMILLFPFMIRGIHILGPWLLLVWQNTPIAAALISFAQRLVRSESAVSRNQP